MLRSKHIILFVIMALLASAIPALAESTVPVLINGDVIELGLDTDRDTAATELAAILPGVEPTVMLEDMIQYDVFAVEDGAPVSIVLYFGSDGKLVQAMFDAYTKEANPVAQDLLVWLSNNLGDGMETDGALVWEYAGMTIEFIDNPDAGEDSVYGIFITKIGYDTQSVESAEGTYNYVEEGYTGTMTITQTGPGFTFAFSTTSRSNGQMCEFETYETPMDQGGGRVDDYLPAHGGTEEDGIKFTISFAGDEAIVDVESVGQECGMSGYFGGRYVKVQ